MGHVRVSIGLANPNRPHDLLRVESARVDTGATLSTLPRQTANQLGLEVSGKHRARTAAGITEVDRSLAYISIEGRDVVTPVWISDSYPGVLIGVTTLELLGFAADPVSEKLIDSEFLLL